MFKLKDPPEYISVGLAWGAAVSFTPLLGLHIIICFLGTYLMKGNLLAAAAEQLLVTRGHFHSFFLTIN